MAGVSATPDIWLHLIKITVLFVFNVATDLG